MCQKHTMHVIRGCAWYNFIKTLLLAKHPIGCNIQITTHEVHHIEIDKIWPPRVEGDGGGTGFSTDFSVENINFTPCSARGHFWRVCVSVFCEEWFYSMLCVVFCQFLGKSCFPRKPPNRKSGKSRFLAKMSKFRYPKSDQKWQKFDPKFDPKKWDTRQKSRIRGLALWFWNQIWPKLPKKFKN